MLKCIFLSAYVLLLYCFIVQSQLTSKVHLSNINQCYHLGLQRAKSLFSTKYPVLDKDSSTLRAPLDVPAEIDEVVNEVKPQSRDSGFDAFIAEETVRCIAQRKQLTKEEVLELPNINFHNTLLTSSCQYKEQNDLPVDMTSLNQKEMNMQSLMNNPQNPCLLHPYRTESGWCNNPVHAEWGASFRPFNRLLPPDYDDSISSPRARSEVTGKVLPNPRVVSSTVHTESNNPENIISHMVMQWGQFLDHDLTHTPHLKIDGDYTPKCCDEDRVAVKIHPECFTIYIPRTDYYFRSRKSTNCMHLVRSLPASRSGCRLGPREQMNQLTSYIDASNVYGSSEKEAKYLRTLRGGLLRGGNGATTHGGKDVLPPDLFAEGCRRTRRNEEHRACFKSGDIRVNEQIGLTAMHTIWLREHNRIVGRLSQLNPHWNDERLYQEGRKIVGAMMQHITYNTYLPVTLGQPHMDAYELNLEERGYFNGYNVSEDATIVNVFATAAFRYGHSLIQSFFEVSSPSFLHNTSRTLVRHEPLADIFFKPYNLYEQEHVDEYLHGMTRQPSQKCDRFVSHMVTQRLFEDPPGRQGFGRDLAALNIQRGRDHGIASWVYWREGCGLSVPRSFSHLRQMRIMEDDAVSKLSELYGDIRDVDLFPAGIAEAPSAGAMMGPTFACIISYQFRKLRHGDRFWYENGIALPSRFTDQQLTEIRKASLARAICDNSLNLNQIQKNVFLLPSDENPLVPCDSISQIDLSAWYEDENDLEHLNMMEVAMQRKPKPPKIERNSFLAKQERLIDEINKVARKEKILRSNDAVYSYQLPSGSARVETVRRNPFAFGFQGKSGFRFF